MTVHHSSIKLSDVNEGIKLVNGDSRPDRVFPVGKEDRPKVGRLPNREDDDSVARRSDADFFPRSYQFADRRAKEEALVRPTDGKGVCGQRSRERVPRKESSAASVGRGGKRVQSEARRQKTRL